MDWSATHCRPIAQQSAKIVRPRQMQRSTLTSLATDCECVNPSRVKLFLDWGRRITALGQLSFDFQLERQTKDRTNEHSTNGGVAAQGFENADDRVAAPNRDPVGSNRLRRDLRLW